MKKSIQHIFLTLLMALSTIVVNAQHPGIIADKDCPILIPNAFTPNDDGINDFFYVTFKENCVPTTFDLQIMDRRGRLVFETKDYQEKWDGTFNSQKLTEGAYIWIMRAKLPTKENPDQVVEKKGTLLLIH